MTDGEGRTAGDGWWIWIVDLDGGFGWWMIEEGRKEGRTDERKAGSQAGRKNGY
jgi:hypothetical protein